MFNQFAWDLYLSSGGKEVAAMFERNLQGEFSEEYIEKICEFHKAYCPSKSVNRTIFNNLSALLKDYRLQQVMFYLEEDTYTIEDALETLYNEIDADEHESFQKNFKFFSSWLEYFSTVLSMQLPELFVPYYFVYNFNVVQKICDEFGIKLPSIPFKKDYEGRF